MESNKSSLSVSLPETESSIMTYSHRISLFHCQTDGDIAGAEKISLSGRRATNHCKLSPRQEGWVNPRVLSCLYFVKNNLRHSERAGITSIAVRGLALLPKDCPVRIVVYSHRMSLFHRQTDGDMGSAPKNSYTQELVRKRRQLLKNGNAQLHKIYILSITLENCSFSYFVS